MKIPLIVKGSPNCEPATVLVPKGKWIVESNHKDSVIALCYSNLESSVNNGNEFNCDKNEAVTLKFLEKGKESEVSVYLQKVS